MFGNPERLFSVISEGTTAIASLAKAITNLADATHLQTEATHRHAAAQERINQAVIDEADQAWQGLR